MSKVGRSPFDLVRSVNNEVHNKTPTKKNPQALTNRTQKVALALLQQEEKNAVRGRLESLLQQQFVRKYGSKNPSSKINAAIKSKIREFLESHDDIRDAEADIGALEQGIKDSVSVMKRSMVTEKARREESRSAPQVPRIGSGAGLQNGNSVDADLDANRWPVVNAIMQVEAEQKRLKEEEAARLKKQRYQDELARQIQLHNDSKQQAKEQKERDMQGVKSVLTAYEQEQQRLRQEKEERHRLEREMREAQIEENKRQKDRERQLRIAQEQGEIARARRIMQEEEEARRQMKARQKQQQDDLKEENERNKAMKEQALRERQAYEKKLNADYEAKLAREEEARQRAFQARVDALAQFSKSYENRVGRTLQQQKVENDKLVAASLEESDRKRLERERGDAERRRQQALTNTEYNISMMEQKKQAQEAERVEALTRRLRLEQEATEQRRRDREEAEKKRLQMLELKGMLDSQVALRQHGERNAAALTSIEATLNKSITKKLAEDPALLHKVAEVVRPTVLQSSRSDAPINTGRRTNNIFF